MTQQAYCDVILEPVVSHDLSVETNLSQKKMELQGIGERVRISWSRSREMGYAISSTAQIVLI